MTHAVLCAGRMYCDVIFTGAPRLPTPGTEVFADGVSLHAGGGAFITGATLAALGHEAALFARLPAAPFDITVSRDLEAHGVSSQHCARPPEGAEPQLTVAIACGADRAFLTRATGPALPGLEAGLPRGFGHLHIGELGTLEENPALLDHARARGMTVSLDCGWQDRFQKSAFDLIAAVDIFLPNQRELDALIALGLDMSSVACLVVKGGQEGARGRRKEDAEWVVAPTRAVPVVDATGAGDAFNGGFLTEWLRGADMAACLAMGNHCGAASVQAVGGAGGLHSLFDTKQEAVASK